MHNRSTFEIAAAILKAAQNKETKTRLTYGACVSFKQLCKYLDFLIAQQMIEYVSEDGTYRTTKSGIIFLRNYEQMSAIMLGKHEKSYDTTHKEIASLQN